MSESLKQVAQQGLEALELAMDNLREHGDNCFLHDEGEYNSCFCGKDSLMSHLQSTVEGLAIALSQPAPSPQPAVPVVSDARMNEAASVLGNELARKHAVYLTLGSVREMLARAILALRPAVEPMTEWEIADIFERWDATSGASMSDFVRMVEAHHGITAKAEDAHQPTNEAEK